MPPTSTTSSIVGGLETGVLQRLAQRAHRALQQVVGDLLELRAAQLEREVLGARGIGRDERQVDLGLQRGRQLALRLLGGLLQSLQGHLVLREVDPLVLLELRHDPVDHALVEVVAAEVGVAVRGLHLHDALAHLEHRDVEGAAAEVVDRDRLVLLLVEAVGERRGGRLVDDAQHLEARDLPGVLRRLALRVVEVRGHRDHRLRDLLAEVVLGRLLQLLEDLGRDLGRRVHLAGDRDAGVAVAGLDDLVRDHLLLFGDFGVLPSHEALDREDGVLGVRDRLALGHLAHQALGARAGSLLNATTDGVVRPPSAFAMTLGSPPSRTATTEFVVPRSIPITLLMSSVASCRLAVAREYRAVLSFCQADKMS